MLNPSLETRLARLAERHEEISALLSDPKVIGNQDQFRKLSQEYAEVSGVVSRYRDYRRVRDDREAAEAMAGDPDPAAREMAEEELARTGTELESLAAELQVLLLPKDPNDARNVFLEIRAGADFEEHIAGIVRVLGQ